MPLNSVIRIIFFKKNFAGCSQVLLDTLRTWILFLIFINFLPELDFIEPVWFGICPISLDA